MKKKLVLLLVVAILLMIPLGPVSAYESLNGSTELIYYDKGKAYNGYHLFTHTYTFLIDMEGNVINMWDIPEGWTIEKTARLLENGNLLRAIRSPIPEGGRGGGTATVGAIFQELDWEGNVVWEVKDPRLTHLPHHNFKRIFNKKLKAYTIIYSATRGSGKSIYLSHEEVVAHGADPSGKYETARPDACVEIDMNGNIVWEWWSFDHVVQDKNPDWPNYGIIAENPGKLDLNWGVGVGNYDFIHQNSLDYNEELDHIVVNASTQSEFFIIDHGATFIPGDLQKSIALAAGPKGDILYRWGNPSVYDCGKEPSYHEGSSSEGHQQVHFTHDIQWIKPGLPGAGHFLLFDNGSRRVGVSRSAIVEVNPYDGPMEKGIYIPEVEAGYTDQRGGKGGKGKGGRGPAPKISKQIVWSFTSSKPNGFYSRNISGAQRLPNGNTLASSGAQGHFFEVTNKGEVVWEYINPMIGGGKSVKVLNDKHRNSVFTSHRYGPDYPGLKGKKLTPLGPITTIITKVGEKVGAGVGGGY